MKSKWLRILLVLLVLLAMGFAYVRGNPLVFNESFWQHAHCMKAGTLGLLQYADAHGGTFPAHPGGYGDALLLLPEYCCYGVTGPGYDETPLVKAKQSGAHLLEEQCGRVYIQGLTTTPKAGSTKVVILFDKLPTPGGDHAHVFQRMYAPLGREVGFVAGHTMFVEETNWPAFAKEQIELLVGEGIPRAEAERLYAQGEVRR
jgi:hypothetical protein